MKALFLIFFSLASGLMVSAGVFAFIAAIGIVPRMAWRTGTRNAVRFYEDMIVLGGICGTVTMFVDFHLQEQFWLFGGIVFLEGIFVGVLAMALTEVLNVMPILMRRSGITRGLSWLILAFAFGKVAGSLLYYFIDGFYVM
jgi:stage V sporulation protein AB